MLRGKYVRHRRQSKIKLIIWWGGGIAGLIGLGIFAVGSPLFRVSRIICSQDNHECPPEIIAELARWRGKHVLGVRLAEAENRIRRADPQVKSANARLSLPQTLVVELVNRSPALLLLTTSTGQPDLISDDEGWLMGVDQSGLDLPKMVWDRSAPVEINQQLPEHLLKAWAIMKLLWPQMDTGSPPKVKEDDFIVKFADNTLIVFSLSKSVTWQLDTLQRLLNQARIDEVIYREIDLRFEKPIILR